MPTRFAMLDMLSEEPTPQTSAPSLVGQGTRDWSPTACFPLECHGCFCSVHASNYQDIITIGKDLSALSRYHFVALRVYSNSPFADKQRHGHFFSTVRLYVGWCIVSSGWPPRSMLVPTRGGRKVDICVHHRLSRVSKVHKRDALAFHKEQNTPRLLERV